MRIQVKNKSNSEVLVLLAEINACHPSQLWVKRKGLDLRQLLATCPYAEWISFMCHRAYKQLDIDPTEVFWEKDKLEKKVSKLHSRLESALLKVQIDTDFKLESGAITFDDYILLNNAIEVKTVRRKYLIARAYLNEYRKIFEVID